jgi:zinc protease
MRGRTPVIFVALAGLASLARGQALHVTPPPLAVTRVVESNGLVALLSTDHHVPVVSVQVWYHVGSKNEPPGRTGFAHLFEHLMFKGSEHVKPEQHSHYIQSIGGRVDATTDFDRTLYYETIPSNYLERILWMEADRMRSLDVSAANFTSERDVVKEERRLRFDDPPFGHLLELVLANAFTKHPYHSTPIGSMKDLDAATLADVQEFYKTFYVPDNATLVVSGDFDPEQVKGWIDRYFGAIPRGTRPIQRSFPAEPQQASVRRQVVHDPKAPLPAVALVFHIPAERDADFRALDVMSNILSAGESSRLYRELVYRQQIALSAGGETLGLEDPGLFYFYAIVQQGHTAEQAEQALLAAVETLQNEPVSEAELTKAKNEQISRLVQDRAAAFDRGEAIGHAAVILGDWTWVNRELPEYEKVTAADIERVARTYLQPARGTFIWMLPPVTGDAKSGSGGQR